MRRGPISVLAGVVLLATVACAASATPAFPGAQGFGSETKGGRGGRVIKVTTLDDRGPGSLRAALEAKGPRTIVFDTGGTIILQKTLEIAHPYVTVAGQSAPGGGIQLRNDPIGSAPRDSFPTLRITTHDVVIRYLRIRPGTLDLDPSCALRPRRGKEQRCAPPNDIEAIALDGGAERVVFDHVSAGWSTDEIVGVNWANDVTFQWSIFAEGLNYVFYDPQDPRKGKGMTFGNKANARRGRYARRISVHHDLFASNEIRNPQATSACGTPNDPSQCLSDVRNNVVYNWGKMGTFADNIGGHNFVNVVGNVYKPGPDTISSPLGILDWTMTTRVPGAGSRIAPFFGGNLLLGRDGSPQPIQVHCSKMGRGPNGKDHVIGLCRPDEFTVSAPYDAPAITTSDVHRVFDSVLADVGASSRRDESGNAVPARDATDRRIVAEVRSGGGRIVRSPGDFPGWPVLDPGQPYVDSDGDGMPDAWEVRYGFDPKTADDPAADADGDGYTNLEEYLNGTDPNRPD